MHYDVRAKLYLLRPEEGGRESPLLFEDIGRPLYRPLFDVGLGEIDGLPAFCAGQVSFPHPGLIALGKEYVVRIELECPEGVIRVGVEFTIRERPRKVVGRGKIEEVLAPPETAKAREQERGWDYDR